MEEIGNNPDLLFCKNAKPRKKIHKYISELQQTKNELQKNPRKKSLITKQNYDMKLEIIY